MDVIEAIYHRRSVRAFTTDAVPSEVIDDLVSVAVQAPSAMNLQPWARSENCDSVTWPSMIRNGFRAKSPRSVTMPAGNLSLVRRQAAHSSLKPPSVHPTHRQRPS